MNSVYISCPSIDGKIESTSVTSLFNLGKKLFQNGINSDIDIVSGISIISVARDISAYRFMKTDFSHIVMIDSDIGINPDDIIECINSGYDFCAIPYRKRTDGLPAFSYSTQYENEYASSIFRPGNYAGTGAMVLSRKVFESMDAPSYPWYDIELKEYFKSGLNSNNVFIGEDVNFCDKWTSSGEKIWIKSDGKTSHVSKILVEQS